MFYQKSYNQYKKCLACVKCPPKGCVINLEWENMDRGYYIGTGHLLTQEKFTIYCPWSIKSNAEIYLEKIDDVTELNSWILACVENTEHDIDITFNDIDEKTIEAITPICEGRGTITILANKPCIPNKYKGWQITRE
jgi:hypothetical protein